MTQDNLHHQQKKENNKQIYFNEEEEEDEELMQIDEKEIVSKSQQLKQSSLKPLDYDIDMVDEMDLQTLMRIYYARLFPFEKFIQWLSYGDSKLNPFILVSKLSHREFSFTLRNNGEEVYLRYCSYSSKQEFKNDLILKNPEKIDIGAVFSAKPKMKNSLRPGTFKPKERELVFDIDMTDYDSVRTCCQGADICLLCWKFMTISVKILNSALTEDFGFKNLLWVYSGRRGVHCWVCDEKARGLSEECRKAIVSYLEVIKGGENKAKKVTLPPVLHPSIDRASKILKVYFEDVVLDEQDILNIPEKAKEMLEMVQNEQMRLEISNRWNSLFDSKEKWDCLCSVISQDKKSEQIKNEIMFQYLYPRLDAQVSMHLNHLLKSPFCVHPKTGKVCVPFRAEDCELFNPLTVPTAQSLCKEVNEMRENSGNKEPDWKKTSMGKYVKIMDEFLYGLRFEIEKVKDKKAMQEWVNSFQI